MHYCRKQTLKLLPLTRQPVIRTLTDGPHSVEMNQLGQRVTAYGSLPSVNIRCETGQLRKAESNAT